MCGYGALLGRGFGFSGGQINLSVVDSRVYGRARRESGKMGTGWPLDGWRLELMRSIYGGNGK